MKIEASRNKTNFTPMNKIYAEIKNTLPVAQIGTHYSPRVAVKGAFSTVE